MIDFVAMWYQGILPDKSILKVYEEYAAATSAKEAILTILAHSIFLIPAFVILRKKKLNEVIEKQN